MRAHLFKFGVSSHVHTRPLNLVNHIRNRVGNIMQYVIRAVGLIVVNGKWSCDYTDQGMAARHRALDRGYRGSRPPQPRDQSIRAYTAATNEDIFCTQYAVRRTQYSTQYSVMLRRRTESTGQHDGMPDPRAAVNVRSSRSSRAPE